MALRRKLRLGGPGFHPGAQLAVERGHRDEDHGRFTGRQLLQDVQVPRHQVVLGDDGHRVAEGRKHLQATAGKLQPALHRLIRVGHAAQGDDLRLPAGRCQLTAQQLRRPLLHQDPRFEIEAGGETQIFVSRARVAVDAAVLAPAVRIDAGIEAHVRAVVVRDDGPGGVLEKSGGGSHRNAVRHEIQRLETVPGIVAASSSAYAGCGLAHHSRKRARSVCFPRLAASALFSPYIRPGRNCQVAEPCRTARPARRAPASSVVLETPCGALRLRFATLRANGI